MTLYYTFNPEKNGWCVENEDDSILAGPFQTYNDARAWKHTNPFPSVVKEEEKSIDDMTDDEILAALAEGTTTLEQVEAFGVPLVDEPMNISTGEERIDPNQ